LALTFAGAGTGSVAVANETEPKNSPTCTKTCSESLGNNDKGTLTATPTGSSTFAGWSAQSGGVSACAGTPAEGTCKFNMGNNPQSVTATFTKVTDGAGTMTVSPTSTLAG